MEVEVDAKRNKTVDVDNKYIDIGVVGVKAVVQQDGISDTHMHTYERRHVPYLSFRCNKTI